MTAITLYEIAAEYRQMVEKLMATDNDEQTIADTIEGESYPLEIKAQNVAYAIKTLQANAEAIKGAEEAMTARRKAMENRAERIREYLLTCMTVAGVQKIECPHFAIKIAANPPSVVIDDERQIPPEFMKQPEPPPPQLDKKAIGEVLKKGGDVPGARLVRGKRVDIR
jgi:carboxylesterase type B